jgi:putative peptidoglycan lipid II flippase
MRATVSSGLRLMLMLNVPAAVGLVVLARPIVALIFERGAFTPADTAATAAALVAYSPGLIGYSAVKLASPTFYALGDSRTPVVVSVVSVLVNVVLNVSLVRVLGYTGLASATAASAILNATVLLVLLRRRLGGLDDDRLARALLKILAASVFMAGACYGVSFWLEGAWPGQGFVPRAARVGASIGGGLLALAVAARVLRIAEFGEAARRVTARIRTAAG